MDYRTRQQRPATSSTLPLSSDRHSPSSKKQRIEPRMLPPGRPGSEMSPGGFSYAPSMRGASGSSYGNNNAPYYPGQSFVPPSFDSFSSSRGQRNLPTPYNEYPLGSSSRPPPHRNPSGDPFGTLLDDDATRQTLPAAQGAGYTGIDWPVHNTGGRRTFNFIGLRDTRLTCNREHEHERDRGKCGPVVRKLDGLPGRLTGRGAGGRSAARGGTTGKSGAGD